MSESTENPAKSVLSKPTKHPEKVIDYMEKKGTSEPLARDLVARDLLLKRESKRKEKAQELSLRDSLTGLWNKRALIGDENVDPPIIGEIVRMFAHSQRTGEPLTAAMLDLDLFREYNNDFGHPAGDEALVELAKIIQKAIRKADFIARFGGEEFVVLLPNTNIENGLILIERLRQKVEKSAVFKRQVTISGGVACYDKNNKLEEINTEKELLEKADIRAYRAKKNGRNRIVFSDNEETLS